MSACSGRASAILVDNYKNSVTGILANFHHDCKRPAQMDCFASSNELDRTDA